MEINLVPGESAVHNTAAFIPKEGFPALPENVGYINKHRVLSIFRLGTDSLTLTQVPFSYSFMPLPVPERCSGTGAAPASQGRAVLSVRLLGGWA